MGGRKYQSTEVTVLSTTTIHLIRPKNDVVELYCIVHELEVQVGSGKEKEMNKRKQQGPSTDMAS